MLSRIFAGLLMSLLALKVVAQDQNLNDVPIVWAVPAMIEGPPAAGQRVRAVTSGWEKTQVQHATYLPTNWVREKKWPVIVEYPGNGGYANQRGDQCDGSVTSCMLGYGISGGTDFIWVSLPFVSKDGTNETKWWGDIEQTKRYCRETVLEVCERLGGDSSRVVLSGFSRGAIACSYVGLHDESMAKLWCGLLCHSHVEGEFRHPAPDYFAWPDRMQRLGKKPMFVSHELSVLAIQSAFQRAKIGGNITFAPLPYANHSARWALCDVPLRHQAREWLLRVTENAETTAP
ncbi:MAG: hypothetical protein ABL921_28110 [Pirellula sp.]